MEKQARKEKNTSNTPVSLVLSYILLLYVLEGYRGRMGYLVGRNKAQIRVTVREKADRETQKRSTSLIAAGRAEARRRTLRSIFHGDK